MITLTLTDEEQDVLRSLLDTSIDDLRQEIHETDRSKYKDMLRHYRENLTHIRGKVVQVPDLETV